MKRITIIILTLLIISFNISIKLNAELSITDQIHSIEGKAIPLTDTTSLSNLLNKAAQHKLVLLGESTHGTSEYYHWRSVISKKLIEDYGFNFIVVEGDWPSFFIINRSVKGISTDDNPDYRSLLADNFNRWPQWMWANEETLNLVEWLHSYNRTQDDGFRVGIYGMDVYSKKESIAEVRTYLNSFDNELYRAKISLYDCFTQYGYDGSNYARAIHFGAAGCENNVLRVVNFLRTNASDLIANCEISYFNAKQNALIVKNAEKHFRTAVQNNADSWNHRVLHFHGTINRLLDYYGEEAKGIVWAHNTHIGDAGATSMAQQGSLNIGQLTRQDMGRDNVFLIGFGCYEGEVYAGSSWGSERQVMKMPPARSNTIENYLNQTNHSDFYLIFDEELKQYPLFSNSIGHRAVGVVYNPLYEYPGNYVPTVMAERYDAFIFFNKTTPLKPLK